MSDTDIHETAAHRLSEASSSTAQSADRDSDVIYMGSISEALGWPHKSKPRKVQLPPAHLLVVLSKLLLSSAAYTLYVEPTILDMRHEHYEALQVGNSALARWVIIRGYISVVWPLIFGILKTVLRW